MAGRAGDRRSVAVTADGTLGHEIGVSEERMSLEERSPREVPFAVEETAAGRFLPYPRASQAATTQNNDSSFWKK